MYDKTAMALALTLVAGVVGLGMAPASPVVAVTADCTHDFDIPDSELLSSPRTLAASASETGRERVMAVSGDEDVRVELQTNDDQLEFGIFEDINGCVRSTNVSPASCESDVLLDTTDPNEDEDSHLCKLLAPSSGSRTFYVVFENVQSSDALEYEVFLV